MLYRIVLTVAAFCLGCLFYLCYQKYSHYTKRQIINHFFEAWSAHDIDKIMSFMTKNPTFFAALGVDTYGSKYVGQEAVRSAILRVLNASPSGKWLDAGEIYISGNYVTAPFLFVETDKNGNRNEIYGVDLLTFEGNKISVKDAYRKTKI